MISISLLLNNLLQLIYKKLPKYIACWANSNINGNLFFGFDDNRIISGIPTLNEIPSRQMIGFYSFL